MEQTDLLELSPSPSVKKFGKDIVLAAKSYPILDVACGQGRNSTLLSHLGGRVIGMDIDLSQLEAKRPGQRLSAFHDAFRRIEMLQIDLMRDKWPYQASTIGGIINIHFLHLPLLALFSRSLISGGMLILETVEDRGNNYLQLPREGTVRATLGTSLTYLSYKERRAGPEGSDAVIVQLAAAKVPRK